MVALETPEAVLGWKAAPFKLKGVDGKVHTLESAKGSKGLLVMFICNHCPYVQATLDNILRDARELAQHGIGSIAIMPNDTVNYPEDSFENMQRLAQQKRFPFPYAIDPAQEMARAYGAVCTPDFFGFNAQLELQYRGRLDASRCEPVANAKRELFEAMAQVAKTGKGPAEQLPSIGCSIKWKEAA